MTTIPCRSFSGSGLAQFASTLFVCAGLVLLLPEPVSSDRAGSSDAGTSVCVAPPHGSQDHQWSDDVLVEAPDSCDDEDDDDDGDDESSGSGQAMATSHRTSHFDDASHVVHVDSVTHMFRPLDAHSLRGPPAIHQESSDADVDDDDDDDAPRAYHPVPLAAATSRQPHSSPSSFAFRAASIGSSHALRAPPQ